MFLDFNIAAKINKNAKFYGSLSMNKFYNVYAKNNTSDQDDPLWDYISSQTYGQGPLVFIDRAYVDYSFDFCPNGLFFRSFPNERWPSSKS